MLPMLLNLPRARMLMERDRIDAIVAQLPINVYYLSGYWGLMNNVERFDAAYLAVLPRREDQPAALILPGTELRRLSSEGGTWMPSVLSFTAPGDDEGEAETAMPYTGWPVRPGASLTPREQDWVRIVSAHSDRQASDSLHALARAAREAGLSGARVLGDDPRIGEWLAGLGVTLGAFEYRPTFFNEIRKIKTISELDLIREAARVNEAALLTAGAALHEGALWDEIENVYLAEMARRGGRGVYCIGGIGGLPAVRARRGEPILLDALGQYRRYHGDFGRCAVIGEPSREHRLRHRALCLGWESIQPLLKPGTRYSEIASTAIETIRRNGFPEFRYVTPHGLGLEHTDDPKSIGVLPGVKPDQVLEPDMVINVDMPMTEIGWGSVHLEDTVRITADGYEPLTSASLDIVIAGA
jgi:Xaa-Pro aminopeptidase